MCCARRAAVCASRSTAQAVHAPGSAISTPRSRPPSPVNNDSMLVDTATLDPFVRAQLGMVMIDLIFFTGLFKASITVRVRSVSAWA